MSEIQSPPDGYDGHVDINNFWDAVATEMISRGLIPCKSCEKTEQTENSCTESKIYQYVLNVVVTIANSHHILIKGGRKNPFVVPPSYHHWAPWIGPHTRRSNSVLNTELEKKQSPQIPNDGDGENLNDDDKIDEERLTDELVNLKVN